MTDQVAADSSGGPSATWGLATYVDLAGNEHVGALRFADESLVAIPGDHVGGLIDAMPRWADLVETLDGWDPRGLPSLTDVRLVAPLRFPRKIICTGANYGTHLAEMGAPVPGPEWQPWFFLKPPTTTVIGPEDAIRIAADDNVDWEGELGVVIGKGGRGIRAADAADHVAGFVALNDVSARGPHFRPAAPHAAFAYDWLASKSQDTFCPMGPVVTPSWLVPDPGSLRLRLWVNDELQQDEHTSGMIIDWPELVAAASDWLTLEPGDVIATGTPAGVGSPRGLFLRDGDMVRIEIEGLGIMRNPVVADGGRNSSAPLLVSRGTA